MSTNFAHRRKEVLVSLVMLISASQFGLGPAQADHAGQHLDVTPPALDVGGIKCSLIPIVGDIPVGISACPGVRPGASIDTASAAGGGRCTLNFLFNGSDGNRYAATAAHCVPGYYDLGVGTSPTLSGEQTWPGSAGPEVRERTGLPIGNFAYAFLGSAAQQPFDFALIRLNTYGTSVSDPQMCHFGGPTSLNSDISTDTSIFRHYGQGAGVGMSLPARTAVSILGMPDAEHVFVQGVAISGDSGSPIISQDGRAVGVITTVGFKANLNGPSEAGDVGVLRLGHMIRRAASKLGTNLTLMTAPVTPTA